MEYLFMTVVILLLISVFIFIKVKRRLKKDKPNIFFVLPSIMAIFIVFFTFTLNKSVDTKLVEYSARYIKHYSNWIEKVDGKDVTHEDVYYLVYDDFDTGKEVEIEISKNTFMYFQGLWKNKEDIIHPQNKSWHMCRSKWNNNPETALIFSKPVNYYNYMNNILPIYKLYDVDISEALKKRLFMKYSIGRVVNSDNILEPRQNFVYGINIPDSLERKIGYICSLDPMFRPILLVWQNSYKNKTELQRSFWSGGKENEAIFCIGIDENDTITWSGSFSWDRDKKFEKYILEKSLKPGTKLNIENYSDCLLSGYQKNYWNHIELDSYNFIQIPFINLITIIISGFIVILNLATIIKVYKKAEQQ